MQVSQSHNNRGEHIPNGDNWWRFLSWNGIFLPLWQKELERYVAVSGCSGKYEGLDGHKWSRLRVNVGQIRVKRLDGVK